MIGLLAMSYWLFAVVMTGHLAFCCWRLVFGDGAIGVLLFAFSSSWVFVRGQLALGS